MDPDLEMDWDLQALRDAGNANLMMSLEHANARQIDLYLEGLAEAVDAESPILYFWVSLGVPLSDRDADRVRAILAGRGVLGALCAGAYRVMRHETAQSNLSVSREVYEHVVSSSLTEVAILYELDSWWELWLTVLPALPPSAPRAARLARRLVEPTNESNTLTDGEATGILRDAYRWFGIDDLEQWVAAVALLRSQPTPALVRAFMVAEIRRAPVAHTWIKHSALARRARAELNWNDVFSAAAACLRDGEDPVASWRELIAALKQGASLGDDEVEDRLSDALDLFAEHFVEDMEIFDLIRWLGKPSPVDLALRAYERLGHHENSELREKVARCLDVVLFQQDRLAGFSWA